MPATDFRPWCSNMFQMLAIGGVWGVPRSGLVFRREADALQLIAPDSLDAAQAADLESITAHFAEAGIAVRH